VTVSETKIVLQVISILKLSLRSMSMKKIIFSLMVVVFFASFAFNGYTIEPETADEKAKITKQERTRERIKKKEMTKKELQEKKQLKEKKRLRNRKKESSKYRKEVRKERRKESRNGAGNEWKYRKGR